MTTGSVTGAARLLARSQPAVTRLVQELESEIGYDLLTRKGPRVTPTEQGLLLFDEVERALGGLRRVRERAGEIARGQSGPLLIAATSALAIGLVPEALRRVEAKGGPLSVHLRSAAPEEVVHAVLFGAVQIGATSLPFGHAGVAPHWIGQVPCVAVLPHDHPLARKRKVSLAALASQRLVTMSNPFRLRHRLDAALAREGVEKSRTQPLIETNSSANAMALVRAGLGVAVLESITAGGGLPEGLVVRPLDTHIPFFFGVVKAEARPLTPTAEAVADAMLQAAATLPGFVRHDPKDHDALLRALHGEDDAAAPRRVARSGSR
ncbi:MAG: LysR family transcriptional regulator [Ramlibacter sp.]|nr:LysR family transcriptional regulator [Ramlibacter sp.]MDB5914854.1 LysR family transcriptional regulator [Ramlibacter sp.]